MRVRILCIGLLLHSCVSIPDHEYATLSESSQLTLNEKEAINSGSFSEGEWPNAQWWKEYDDPVLTELIETAIEKNPTIKLAEARLQSATQESLEKRSILFPELGLDGNTNYEHFSKFGFFRSVAPTVPPVLNDITLNLSYKWEVDFWGKNRNIFNAALGEVRARAAEVDAAKLILTTSIAYTYAELQFYFRKKEILEGKSANNHLIVNSRNEREKHAIETSMDVLRSEMITFDVEGQIANLEIQIQKCIHELKALSGLGQEAQIAIVTRPMRTSIARLPNNLSFDLLARRPDLAAQKERVEAAAKMINAAKTDFYPSVNLLGFAGLESIHFNTIFKQATFNGSLEPAVHLPIFTAGRIKANLMDKLAEFNQAVQSYNDLILHAAQDVADRLSEILLIDREIVIRKKELETASKLERLSQRRLLHALDTQINLAHVQNNLLDTELIVVGLEYGKQLANVLLIRSLGGGIHE